LALIKVFMPMISEVVSASNEKKETPFSIGFDAKRAFFNKSGLGNYSRNLLASLVSKHPENTYYLFTPKIKNRIILENEKLFNLIEPGRKFFKLFGSLWRFKYIDREIKQNRLDIYHGLSQELPVGIENTGVKSVITVHDLIFMRFPEFYNRIDSKIYYRKLIHACHVSDHIIAISQQTKQDLIELLKISPDKISVIYQGCNPNFWNRSNDDLNQEVRIKYNLPERYLLYVGTIEERKNLLGLVKALDIKNINIPLVVIGRKAENYFPKVQNYISSHNLRNIIFPGHIRNQDLPEVYQNAECFIYPSLFEGFGIPLLEALVSGVPVISSKGGCFSEAGGPGSIYVDPHNSDEIGEAILRVLNDKDLRDNMITTGKIYANNFKDDNIADAYMNIYHSLLK
jgi:glycosyltransferase involved in cell wall biosynthesis